MGYVKVDFFRNKPHSRRESLARFFASEQARLPDDNMNYKIGYVKNELPETNTLLAIKRSDARILIVDAHGANIPNLDDLPNSRLLIKLDNIYSVDEVESALEKMVMY